MANYQASPHPHMLPVPNFGQQPPLHTNQAYMQHAYMHQQVYILSIQSIWTSYLLVSYDQKYYCIDLICENCVIGE
jgi:hypothetical protein